MYTTGEIAKLCDVSVRTVQYYDTRGILVPSQLSEGGRRLYSEQDLGRMRVICFLRELGISINGIATLLADEHPEQIISLLLDGQELAWNPDLNFYDQEPIRYYYDETILALTWKEIINGNMVTFGEVKFAHPSQLRRAVTGNRYDYGIDEYPTKLAQNVNAVLASAGDFYGFRDLGITVYQRKLYRHNPASVDTAYFTADGNMIFSKRGELMNRAEAEQFIKDNDVLFAVAFGPVMVENGVPVHTEQYAIGEVNDRYSRAAIAQKDELHYMVMTVNFEGPCQKTCTLAQAVEYIAAKNVQQAYTLDGGQTASVVLGGRLVNRPDWGEERTMSDIIYFASAIPEE
jgi:DNA-binding transcriptional MerR regulator